MRALLVLLLLAGCGGVRCPGGARPVYHPAWGDTCFWPEPPFDRRHASNVP